VIQAEAAFTAPTEWCERPEQWTAHDDQSAECEVTALVGAFIRAMQPDYVIETGTAHGYTAREIGLALEANGHGWLHTLEVDRDLVLEAGRRCSGLPVTVYRQSSMDFTPTESIGFAWFDSLIELRLPEFDRYRKHMPVGTIVGFHDVSDRFGDFRQRLEEHGGFRPIFLHTPRGVCFAQVL
jgi:hypothetical protein